MWSLGGPVEWRISNAFELLALICVLKSDSVKSGFQIQGLIKPNKIENQVYMVLGDILTVPYWRGNVPQYLVGAFMVSPIIVSDPTMFQSCRANRYWSGNCLKAKDLPFLSLRH